MFISKFIRPTPGHEGPRINDQIRADKIRLVGKDGEMLGVVSVREGIDLAMDAGLDLVEISPKAEPPVCKILDYGKYKYELQKKKNEAKKKQKIVEIKEMKLRPFIGENDYQVKLRNMKRFLEDEDKVKVSLRFRGRELAHKEIGMKLFDRIIQDLSEFAKVESSPKFEGPQVIMVLSPL
ncbi:MAG: translation initiation factor IF-3 [Alphaproteobacteria bacterium]